MGTISARKRGNGSTGYMARLRIKRDGEIVHKETKTFNRKQDAAVWLRAREAALAEPGALERLQAPDPTLGAAIDRYISESEKKIGRTKTQVLRTIKGLEIAGLRCSKIGSPQLVAFARSLNVEPQTRGNYLSHLSAVFALARPAWGYPLEQQAMEDAFKVLKRLGITSKSRQRDRRPTLEELDRILEHFTDRGIRRPGSAPMALITAFAIFSTRRQEEIVRITWADYEPQNKRVWVRDMKNPGEKIGNDVPCNLVPEAMELIQAMPQIDKRIFPYSTDALSAAFTRAVKILGIDDLHFHDLRHEGVSRLFEMGWGIPDVGLVSGHKSWQSLQRYTHIRQAGDKYAGWKWLGRLADNA